MTEENAVPAEGQAAETAEDVSSTPSWVETLDPDLKGFVEAKGFKDPAAVLKSYQNLEKLRGVPEDRLLKLPEKMDDQDGMAAVYDRLGRPENADAYTRALGDDFNDDVFKGIAAKAHELGLSDAQFAGLQEVTASLAGQIDAARDERIAAEFDQWKSANADGFNAAARAMAQAGVNEEQLEGILSGDKAKLYDFLAKVGSGLNEKPVTIGDQPAGFNMTPAAAKQKIQELLSDKDFMSNYTSSNSKVRGPAIARMEQLQKAAAQG